MSTSQLSLLRILDDRLAEGDTSLATRDVRAELGLSPQAASNLLERARDAGLVDRVARGHYAIRQLGVLGTRAASEDVALAVAAFFGRQPHRIAFRSALDYHDLLTHPSRTIQVACPRQVTARSLSGRPLKTVQENVETLLIGAVPAGHGAWVSGVERGLLDAAKRLELVGGPAVLAEALAAAGSDPEALQALARELNAAAALRRIGSIADQLAIPGLAGALEPLRTPTADLDLEPGTPRGKPALRDARWRVRWSESPAELAEVVRQ